MITQVLYLNIIVRDYDEALQWYTRCFGWEKRIDKGQGVHRWLALGINGQAIPEIILQVPERFEGVMQERKRQQIGQNPTWVLAVKDCQKAVESMRRESVKILEEPADSPFGRGALVEDLYGNIFSLLERPE